MKIAYFLDRPKVLGGAGNLLLQQAKLMAELYDVIVAIPDDGKGNANNEYARRCEQSNIPYVWLEYNTAFNFATIDYIGGLRSAAKIEEFARKKEITFFHSVQLNIAVEYVARKLGIPHLMNIYQLQKNEFGVCPGDIYAHYHLCDSLLYSNLWRQQLGICSKCIRPVALRDDVKRKTIYPKAGIKILMLGSVCRRKNQMCAIRAIEQCLDSYKVELHIAGDDSSKYAEECITYVKEHKLEQYIIFHGFVSNVEPLLEECDCLLCASVDESFPSSMAEALTYDMTIISTPVAGVPEVFMDKYNSFISADFSITSMKDSIAECFSYYKSGEINEIHKNAIDTWHANFRRETVRQQIDAYYKYILDDMEFKSIDIFLKLKEEIRQERMEVMLKDIDAVGEEWIYTRSLYYMLIKKRLCEGKLYIWGAGKLGKLTFKIFKKLCPDLEILAFVDTYKEGQCCGLPIIKVESLPINKECYYCISFAEYKDEAIHYLERNGLELNVQIWCMP